LTITPETQAPCWKFSDAYTNFGGLYKVQGNVFIMGNGATIDVGNITTTCHSVMIFLSPEEDMSGVTASIDALTISNWGGQQGALTLYGSTLNVTK